MDNHLEVSGNEIQATKHDKDKPPIFFLPARAVEMSRGIISSVSRDFEFSMEGAYISLTTFKVGGSASTLAYTTAHTTIVLGRIAQEVVGPLSDRYAFLLGKQEIAKVFAFGAKKYSVGNWHSGEGFTWSRLLRAAESHMDYHMAGQFFDEESTLYHLAHAGCCFLMLLEHVLTKHGVDDRSPAQFIIQEE
jgi:hypothetical protein